MNFRGTARTVMSLEVSQLPETLPACNSGIKGARQLLCGPEFVIFRLKETSSSFLNRQELRLTHPHQHQPSASLDSTRVAGTPRSSYTLSAASVPYTEAPAFAQSPLASAWSPSTPRTPPKKTHPSRSRAATTPETPHSSLLGRGRAFLLLKSTDHHGSMRPWHRPFASFLSLGLDYPCTETLIHSDVLSAWNQLHKTSGKRFHPFGTEEVHEPRQSCKWLSHAAKRMTHSTGEVSLQIGAHSP